MTIGNAIKGFINWLDKSGNTSTNSNWEPQFVYEHMLKYRAKYITDKLRSGLDIGSENYKWIPCVSLKKVKINECPCVPAYGCSYVKTTIWLPRYLYIKAVVSVEADIRYDFIKWDDFPEQLSHRLGPIRTEPRWTEKITNDRRYHYFHNSIHSRQVSYSGFIPYDLIEYAMMPDCRGVVNKCLNPYDIEFSMDPDMEAQLFLETFNSLVAPRPQETDVYQDGKKDIPGLPLK